MGPAGRIDAMRIGELSGEPVILDLGAFLAEAVAELRHQQPVGAPQVPRLATTNRL
jgi:hypothetical protein